VRRARRAQATRYNYPLYGIWRLSVSAGSGRRPKPEGGKSQVHSLRAGLATSAAAVGVPERVIAQQTGHKGTAMLRRYIREGSLFRENAASAVGL
jgi:integrase